MKLVGIELQNFRSIGGNPLLLSPWRKCNILVGQNNSGKSNAIAAVQLISHLARTRTPGGPKTPSPAFTETDLHRRSPANRFKCRLSFKCSGVEDAELAEKADTDRFWFDLSWEGGAHDLEFSDNSLAHIDSKFIANQVLAHLHITKLPGAAQAGATVGRFLKFGPAIFRDRFVPAIPEVHLIPEFRQIKPGNEYELDGVNLIVRLARFQHPKVGQDTDQKEFDRIQSYVRRLLHMPEAILEVTHDNTEILLSNEGLRLPLGSYGTGVHELVIMLTAVLSIENAICCIEEPEIHLHPRLQRDFIRFITTETANQYLISTHSPSLINAVSICDDLQVFRLSVENGSTVGGPILDDEDALLAMHDLGVRASDLLLCNCVLWVEGPSDRIYIKRWLELAAPDLTEGRDFVIMFYGGRLLSHLSADRDKVPPELIPLLKINQNAIVVMDSDRKRPRTHLGRTKLRVREECQKSGGICWVTHGREIENYLPGRVVDPVCQDLSAKDPEYSIGRYEKFEDVLNEALAAVKAKKLNYASNKVKYARMFAEHFEPDDLVGNLGKHMRGIVKKIRSWNE